jgi:hypothetical protein
VDITERQLDTINTVYKSLNSYFPAEQAYLLHRSLSHISIRTLHVDYFAVSRVRIHLHPEDITHQELRRNIEFLCKIYE